MSCRENIALFDLDGSLADYEGQLRKDLEALRAPGEPPLGSPWEDEHRLPYIAARMRLIKSQPGWWLSLPPIPRGLRVFEAAREMGFNCQVLTKGPSGHPLAWAEKLQWCDQHLGTIPVTITKDKGLVYGKLLYDDFPPYCERWLEHRPRGLVIMPATYYNRDFHHPQVVKWTGRNWRQVEHALRQCFERNENEALEL